MKVWVRMSGGYEPEPVAVYATRLQGLRETVKDIKYQWNMYYRKSPPMKYYYVDEYPRQRSRPETWKEFRNRCIDYIQEIDFYE